VSVREPLTEFESVAQLDKALATYLGLCAELPEPDADFFVAKQRRVDSLLDKRSELDAMQAERLG